MTSAAPSCISPQTLPHQPIFHVCGNAKLSCSSDSFGSLQSGRQLFGLCQNLGCAGSPIVTIEIVAHQFCHVILLTVAPQVAVLPADGIGLHQVGVYLRLVDKTALGAPQGPVLEPGAC